MPEAAREKWGLNYDVCVCRRGKKIVSQGWLCHWKEEMGVKERRENGGEQERFPKLIKCSRGWKLPGSIPVPLDKLALCSLQFLCSAEVASWGHHQGVWGGGGSGQSIPNDFANSRSGWTSEALWLMIQVQVCKWSFISLILLAIYNSLLCSLSLPLFLSLHELHFL